MRTSPDRRNAILSDLYRLHCDGMTILFFSIFIFVFVFVICVEVVLSKNEGILHTMIESGILEILAGIMCSDCDADTLV